MKTIKFFITVCAALTFSINAFAQETDTTITVNGVCAMCEYTIETAATSLKGVKSAEWNVETKVLKLVYDAGQVNLQDINKAINKSGYDTEYSTASDEAYKKLHKCCYYRDPEVVKDHQ